MTFYKKAHFFLIFWALINYPCAYGQLTFNPSVEVTLGGLEGGSTIEAGSSTQIVRTSTFPFRFQDDLPRTRKLTIDRGTLNLSLLTPGTRLFETNIVVTASLFGVRQVASAKIGHIVVSSTGNGAVLQGVVETATIDDLLVLVFLADEVKEIVEGLLPSTIGMNGTISANTSGFTYMDSFEVPNEIVSQDIQSNELEVTVTDIFPVDLYTSPSPAEMVMLTVSNELTSLNGITVSPIINLFTVPGSATPSLTEKLYFPQFGNGQGLTSELVLTNPSITSAANGRIDFFDDDGLPIPLDILTDGGSEAQSSIDVSVPSLGGLTISTDGEGDLKVGSAIVSSDGILGGVVRFSLPGIGIAGVSSSPPLSGFITPVRRTQSGINTGIALVNVEDHEISLSLTLRDKDGETVANGIQTIASIPAAGHLSRFINDIFPFAQTDVFDGFLVVEVTGGQVAATALELGLMPGEFTTLPVTPLEQ